MIRSVLAALLGPADRLLARAVGGGFGLKDLFTIVNLVGGVASICFAIQGNLWWASFAVMLGYLGDVFDGPVARLTGRMNRFGHELDNIADHTAQCVAPAFVVYLAYRDFSIGLAFALAALLIVAGSIRHARGAVASFGFKLAWNGMPRPVAAFLTISFLNSHLFTHVSFGRYVGIGLVVAVALLNLIPLPFMNHHGRRLQRWVVVLVVFWFVSAALVVIVWTAYFWDVLFVWTALYAGGSWVPMTRQERRDFFAAARRWRKALADEAASGEAEADEAGPRQAETDAADATPQRSDLPEIPEPGEGR